MDDGDGVASPEGTFGRQSQGQVALQHVNGILLEREDGAVIQYAEQGDQPEAEARQDFADVGNLERVVFLFGFTSLTVEFLVHEEVDDEHDQGDAEEHHAESNGTAHIDGAAETGEIGRENHAGGHTETGKSHLRTHGQGGFTTLEPFHNTTAYSDTGHFAAATEDHESDGSQFG